MNRGIVRGGGGRNAAGGAGQGPAACSSPVEPLHGRRSKAGVTPSWRRSRPSSVTAWPCREDRGAKGDGEAAARRLRKRRCADDRMLNPATRRRFPGPLRRGYPGARLRHPGSGARRTDAAPRLHAAGGADAHDQRRRAGALHLFRRGLSPSGRPPRTGVGISPGRLRGVRRARPGGGGCRGLCAVFGGPSAPWTARRHGRHGHPSRRGAGARDIRAATGRAVAPHLAAQAVPRPDRAVLGPRAGARPTRAALLAAAIRWRRRGR